MNEYSEIHNEVIRIGADEKSAYWFAKKLNGFGISIRGVKCFAANIIKQEMLSKGADAVINRECITGKTEYSDVLIVGKKENIELACKKLFLQGELLSNISKEILTVLKDVSLGRDKSFKCGKYILPLGKKTYIMGILNVTPDSFSDGGEAVSFEDAKRKADLLVSQGADIIDVGGESTRPGYVTVEEVEEIERVTRIVEYIHNTYDIPISIDTQKRNVASEALRVGANIVNDIWGMQREDTTDLIVKYGAGVVLMHNKDNTVYSDIMPEIISSLKGSVEKCLNKGVSFDNIVVDVGIGFGKDTEQNVEVLAHLEDLSVIGCPILLGTSRKSFIGNTLGIPVEERDEATVATSVIGVMKGVDFVRVHNVELTKKVLDMSDYILRRS